jgi:hypothetical protein
MIRPRPLLVAVLVIAILHCLLAPGLTAALAATHEHPAAEVDCCHHDSHEGTRTGETAVCGEESTDVPGHRQCLCKGAIAAATQPVADLKVMANIPSTLPFVEQPKIAVPSAANAAAADSARHFPPLVTGRLVRALCGSLVI